ncbi:ATP synthase F0 subunit A [Microgenomates group bacterium RIFCSPLOWO2_01_FULL_46_13]|nr:MAG: ATP synthase F0 subunit A [Microgenomates group bacterium RIFCSPHIGHO2_01_FULL_45_11]OGV94671.1 MAG: ATP synthase F0 subunit A [Microgenomates group bacterium RIFCSPLOWO2_01_FULL_46_13]
MASELHISISAEPVFHIGKLAITNSMLTGWLITGLLILFSLWFYQRLTRVSYRTKPKRLQSFVELIIEGLYNLVQSIAGSNHKARIFLPIFATFFLYILLSNWSGLLPGVGSVGFREREVANVSKVEKVERGETEDKFVPYFRGPTADINTTLALAIFSVGTIQVVGFKFLGFHYPTKFFNFSDPIKFFVGFLELFLEFAKIFSFAFRLFGNIFAGEVLLTVIAFLMPVLAPLPFLGLEIFVGFIQALVFSMLTLVFLNLATMGHGSEAVEGVPDH